MDDELKPKRDRRPPERRPPDPADDEARRAYLLRLRREIELGLYHVPAEWIAEKIIEIESEPETEE